MASLPNPNRFIPERDFCPESGASRNIEILDLSTLLSRNSGMRMLSKPHRLNFYSILVITEGDGTHFIDFQPYSLKPGSILFTSLGQVHAFSQNPPDRILKGYQILMTDDYLQTHLIQAEKFSFFDLMNGVSHNGHIDPFDSFDSLARDSPSKSTDGLLRISEELYREYHLPDYALKEDITAALLKLFLLRSEQLLSERIPVFVNNHRYQIFRRFTVALKKEYQTHKTAAEYAQSLAVSYKHLNTLTREFASCSAKEYIDRFLIMEIKRQLVCTDDPIRVISDNCGFSDPAYLIKYFKRHTGLTPVRFRKSL